jgi:hypothetical protein
MKTSTKVITGLIVVGGGLIFLDMATLGGLSEYLNGIFRPNRYKNLPVPPTTTEAIKSSEEAKQRAIERKKAHSVSELGVWL